jgi:FSR family fosmidomycin resistance protein-like MFS transporter
VSDAVLSQPRATTTAVFVLVAISFCHMLNDMMQALLPAIYPILRSSFNLTFAQVGLLTLTYQIVASILQPLIGFYTDRRPQSYFLPLAMLALLVGLPTLAFAPNYATLVIGASILGLGSSIFHPESSRIARLASGGQHGLAQSLFQVGGNFGQALGPLLAALFILPHGPNSLAWFALIALCGIPILAGLGHWCNKADDARRSSRIAPVGHPYLSRAQVGRAMAVLMALIFSKYFYLASIITYYTFYLIHRFHLSTRATQIDLFVFLAAVAMGTVIGGPVGDRFGRKVVIWTSIVGALPFTVALPYVGLSATIVLSVIIGLVLSSAFSAIVVYAQDLMPGRVGLVSGLFFGFAFGMGGMGAAVLGILADRTSIDFVYRVCSFLPLIGLLTALLPDLREPPSLRG